ncbi:hypothetical protein BUALT_Bualt02G0073700 [Buddleja alternifolia]|uniref:Uncharacterized protein n=1 Tax=Buddleja alternifolia TaxID=168488 RepID=A0AAV6Y4K5_9LAMI|nr:hypothetical protein BUALT_Bualt02G0073700 [Buddleja alternifolia]
MSSITEHEEFTSTREEEKTQEQFNRKKLSSTKLRRYDSLDIESGKVGSRYNQNNHGAVAKVETEALFADVGHFSVRSIQISMCIVTYPALILAYMGQASFLRKNELLVADTFYKSIPGQVYVPEINYLLMLACVCVTLGFRTTEKIGNVYVLYKFDQGGYLPLTFAMILMSIMYIWNNVYRKKYYFELDNKISQKKVQEIIEHTNSQRLPGLAVFYSDLVHGMPPIFKHYIENVPALHSVLIFVPFKSLPISKVPIEERFLLRRVQPKDLQVFRCVVCYGYNDVHNEQEPFEILLSKKLKEFILEDYHIGSDMTHTSVGEVEKEDESGEDVIQCDDEHVSIEREKDVEYLDKALWAGVLHLVGEHEVVAARGSNIGKRVLIDYAYKFLDKKFKAK